MESYQQTLVDLNQAIEKNPKNTWALAHRGEAYRIMECYEEALADFNRAIELDNNYVWALAHRGATYRFMGETYYRLALADFNRAIELKPDYLWAIAYRCRLYTLMKRYDKALTDFDRAIALDKTIFVKNWRIERGLLLNYGSKYNEAISCCQQRLQEDPRDSTAWYCIAVAKARCQGLVAAKSEIERSRTVLLSMWDTGDRGDLLYRLSGLAALEDNWEQAWQYLREAIPLNDEAVELVDGDPAWSDWRNEPQTRKLLASKTFEGKT